MGSNLCSSTPITSSGFQLDSYSTLVYGEDQKQGNIQHSGPIKIRQNIIDSINIQNLINQCTEKLYVPKLMYKDPTMPTDKLLLKSITKQSNNQRKQIQAIFLRPYRILQNISKGQSYKIIPNHNESSPNQILIKDQVMQYFAVFLCFVAQNPKIIEEIFLTESNSYGLHAIKMNVQGKQIPVFIDDYILCTNSTPVFTQTVKNMYIWPNLLQKAWFKTHGFTQKIIGKSTPDEVFQAFLNYPYKKYSIQDLEQSDKKQFLKTNLYGLQNQYGYVLTTKKDPFIHIGISGRKYLYLLGSFQCEHKRFFYIRNPCGNFNFRGSYDQIPQNIKNIIKKTFNTLNIPEGNFILEQNQFLEQISIVSICYYSKSFKTTKFSLKLENNNQIFIQTELKTQGNLALCFRQQTHKKHETKFSPITYQIFNMVTGQHVTDEQNNQGCFGIQNSCNFIHKIDLFNDVVKKLPQSKYLIRIKKKDKKKHYFGIQSTLIANFPSQLKFDIKNQQQFTGLFKQYLIKEGKKNIQKENRKTGLNPIQHSVFMLGDLICIYIQYVSQKSQQFKIQISFPSLKNLQIIYPEINLKQVSVLPNTLSHNHKQELIIFEKIDLVGQTQLGPFQLEAF